MENRGYYVLYKASGENHKDYLDATYEEASREQIGYANISDNGVSGITQDRNVAKGWVARCAHLQEGKKTQSTENLDAR